MVSYEYELYKDNKFVKYGRNSDRKYIDNLIKYKRRGKRYKLKVTKGDLILENGSYELINREILFKNY